MASSSSPKDEQVKLPISRLRMIMKSSPGVENIGADSLHVISKATELFIHRVAVEAYNVSDSTDVEYKHLSKCVKCVEELEFLVEIFPDKISVGDYLNIMKKTKEKEVAKQKKEDKDFDEYQDLLKMCKSYAELIEEKGIAVVNKELEENGLIYKFPVSDKVTLQSPKVNGRSPSKSQRK